MHRHRALSLSGASTFDVDPVNARIILQQNRFMIGQHANILHFEATHSAAGLKPSIGRIGRTTRFVVAI